MKILQFDNRSIFADIAEEVATLRVPSAAGSSVSLTIDNNSGLANADYVLIEDVSTSRAEIAKINAAVTAGTIIQVDTLKFPHNVGVKIYKIGYNQIKFFHSDTVAGIKTLLGSATDLDVDDEFTEYVDSVNGAGYAFFALYNSTTTAQSEYSSPYPYSLLALSSKSKIRDFVKKFYKKPIDDETFDMLIPVAEDEIFSIAPWRFREETATFNSVADQADYPFADNGITDFGTLAYITYNGDPVEVVTFKENEILNWGTLISSYARVAHIWSEILTLTPAPSEIAEIKVKYWKNAPGFAEETTDTAVSMPQVIAFSILQDLWAMDDMKKSQYWENRKLQTVALIKKRDEKQTVRFAPLTNSGMIRRNPRSQFENPSIDI